ncbi:MAG: sigma-70 family RNA polymerase sigma factor [Deltaproteobacteria bacterium]|nr:sigma-70 family RNA polymerase sigma factor [Deltaproteobacteria bacterium]
MAPSSPDRQEIHRWMVRLADGDRAAFPPLFEALWPLLRSFSRRLLSQHHDAEDVAQQALLNVFRRAGEFDPQRDALSWIFGITAYECKTVMRRRYRRREEPATPTMDLKRQLQAPDDTEQELIRQELLGAAKEVLGSLSPQDVETLEAAFGNCQRPMVSAAAFRKRLERALKRLRLAWRLKIDSP